MHTNICSFTQGVSVTPMCAGINDRVRSVKQKPHQSDRVSKIHRNAIQSVFLLWATQNKKKQLEIACAGEEKVRAGMGRKASMNGAHLANSTN